MQHYILTLQCQDGPGIIHAVSSALLDVGANVLEQAQFTDQDTGMFAMRTRFEAPEQDAAAIHATLAERAARNYPDDPYLQREWMRAIGVVRRTTRGWLLDRRAARVAP